MSMLQPITFLRNRELSQKLYMVVDLTLALGHQGRPLVIFAMRFVWRSRYDFTVGITVWETKGRGRKSKACFYKKFYITFKDKGINKIAQKLQLSNDIKMSCCKFLYFTLLGTVPNLKSNFMLMNIIYYLLTTNSHSSSKQLLLKVVLGMI